MNNVILQLFRTINNVLKRFNLSICFITQYTDKLETNRPDYVRSGTLELLSREIYDSEVSGMVAELGVYRGDFAKDINSFFPDRKLYLFDTFEGFADEDLEVDRENNYLNCNHDFSKTSISTVLNKMKHRDNCIIKKGFFPDSAQGVEESFCFVSLDADLYQPIKSGLEFFYPRLSKGGYIMVHDYNSNLYLGAKQAVKEFAEKHGINYICLPDRCGSAVFTK